MLYAIGDIHGRLDLLEELLDKLPLEREDRLVFLGDYVDRGMFGVETTIYLLAFKINFPKCFWMLRGNHECRQITDNFNFHRECQVLNDPLFFVACIRIAEFCLLGKIR